MAHAIYFQSAAGLSGRLLASYRGGSTDGVLPHPAVGEGPPMPISMLSGRVRPSRTQPSGSQAAVSQCLGLHSVVWLVMAAGVCWNSMVFFIENLEFSDFARKCTKTWHVATHAGNGARQHLANQHRN